MVWVRIKRNGKERAVWVPCGKTTKEMGLSLKAEGQA